MARQKACGQSFANADQIDYKERNEKNINNNNGTSANLQGVDRRQRDSKKMTTSLIDALASAVLQTTVRMAANEIGAQFTLKIEAKRRFLSKTFA